MTQWKARVFETVMREVLYTVEADNLDDAREAAGRGESLTRKVIQDVEISKRHVSSIIIREELG